MQDSQAYFIIADISGYTRFLTETEIDHAKGVLEDLFGAVIKAIRAPLTISSLQGDAVFAYAIDSDIVSRQFILDFAERVYCIFADTRERMRINTTCPCAACAKIGDLDLKIIVHHGRYVTQNTAGREELAGPDVITAFRLLKNRVKERTGLSAYALITCDAVRHMGIDRLFTAKQKFSETYQHIGEIEYVVHELTSAWLKRRDAERIFVGADDKLIIPEAMAAIPLAPAAAFTLLTRPDVRRHWMGADRIDVDTAGDGRIGTGAVFHCHHGKQTINFEIVDWRPGEYVTVRFRFPIGLTALATEELVPVGDGTLVKLRIGRPSSDRLLGRIVQPLFTRMMRGHLLTNTPANMARLQSQAESLAADNPRSHPDEAVDPQSLGVAETIDRKVTV